nr:MAG TPA: hypothetical protein [Caudoviricetes sp.]
MILLICPNPFGNRRRFFRVVEGFGKVVSGCSGKPQCGQDRALSLT